MQDIRRATPYEHVKESLKLSVQFEVQKSVSIQRPQRLSSRIQGSKYNDGVPRPEKLMLCAFFPRSCILTKLKCELVRFDNEMMKNWEDISYQPKGQFFFVETWLLDFQRNQLARSSHVMTLLERNPEISLLAVPNES
ncbi:hypothetical protein ACTXT7_006932 [Hymenolepis weldensis]